MSRVVIAVCVNNYTLYCLLAYCVEVPSPQVVGWVVTTSSAGPLISMAREQVEHVLNGLKRSTDMHTPCIGARTTDAHKQIIFTQQ